MPFTILLNHLINAMTQTLHLKRCVFIFIFLLSVQQTFSQDKKAPPEDNVFTKVEIEASFPGGDAAWNRYISNAMKNANFDKFKNSDQGTCRVRFIVDKEGNISNVQALTMKRSRLAKLAVDIIQNSPHWNPAQQDKRFVNAYREQPITLTLTDEK